MSFPPPSVPKDSGRSDPGLLLDALQKQTLERVVPALDRALGRVDDYLFDRSQSGNDDLGLTASPAALIGRVSVSQPIDTVLIKISARAASPVEAQRLADAWVRALSAQVDRMENPSGGPEQALRVQPVEAAALPTRPVSPNVTRNIGLGVVVGLLLGLGYAVLRSQLDRKLRSAVRSASSWQARQ